MTASEARNSLPADYQAQLRDDHLRPLWMANVSAAMRAEPGQPLRRAQPHVWSWKTVRERLLRAGELVDVEHAERRVLVLINPGHTSPDGLSADSSLFVGAQLVLPGEVTSRHRHSAGASRFVVEGSSACTIVNGERLSMEPGDLILTPPHHWHEHVNEGKEHVIWLDMLDAPISSALDAVYFEGGPRTPVSAQVPERAAYRAPGMLPFRSPKIAPQRYPMLRYRWSKVEQALAALASAGDRQHPVHLMYVNPETGASVLEAYCYSARMLRPGEEVVPTLSSASAVYHVVSGECESEIGGRTFACQQGDVIALPSQVPLRLRNRSSSRPAYLLQVDNSPLQSKLDWYREWPRAE
jgi:gentisate 1,2-dioxygenase